METVKSTSNLMKTNGSKANLINGLFQEKAEQKEKVARRIIGEDPEWNLAPVSRLANLCVQIIVKNFERNPVLKRIPTKYRDWIISSISTETPLSVAAPLIPDETYWERRSRLRFRLANVHEFGGSWKRLYFELHVRDCIETFEPSHDESMPLKLRKLLNEVQLGAPFIQALHLRQLKPIEPSI
jgi:hypothetical protein